jgi:hypothetical protein
MDAYAVIQQIESAFGDVPYPGDESITPEHQPDDVDYVDVANAFRGRHWRDITAEWLTKQGRQVSFLSVKAFVFFLPGYMIAFLSHPDGASPAYDDIIDELIMVASELRRRSITDQLPFTAEQSLAIAAFLEHEMEVGACTMCGCRAAVSTFRKVADNS